MLKRAHWFGVGGVALIAPLAAILHAGCESTCQVPSDCPSGTFCFIGPTNCVNPVPLGFCTDIPGSDCSQASSPVCGCDSNTYPNACIAANHGQAIATMAVCTSICGISSNTCPTGQVCQFPTIGTCPGQGVQGTCVTPMTHCDNSFDLVCGCNGTTYSNLCEMEKAGQSELTAGGCPCQENGQCGPDQFCAFAANAGNGSGCLEGAPVGACALRPTSCSQLQEPICGCNGQTYTNACIASQMGVNVALMGACPAGILPDGGADGG